MVFRFFNQRLPYGYAIIILGAFLSTVLAQEPPPPQPMPAQIKTGVVAIPNELRNRSLQVAYYDLWVKSPEAFSPNLYDSSKKTLDTVEITEEVFQKQFLFRTTSSTGEVAWLRLESQNSQDKIIYDVTSSFGMTLRIEVAFSELSTESVKGLASVKANSGSGLLPITMSANDYQSNTLPNAGLAGLENERFFNTPAMKRLQFVMLNVGDLQSSAFSNMNTSQRSVKVPESLYWLTSAKTNYSVPQCRSFCFRVSTLIPIFMCDGGGVYGCNCPQASGFWIMPQCVVRAFCSTACSAFPRPRIATVLPRLQIEEVLW